MRQAEKEQNGGFEFNHINNYMKMQSKYVIQSHQLNKKARPRYTLSIRNPLYDHVATQEYVSPNLEQVHAGIQGVGVFTFAQMTALPQNLRATSPHYPRGLAVDPAGWAEDQCQSQFGLPLPYLCCAFWGHCRGPPLGIDGAPSEDIIQYNAIIFGSEEATFEDATFFFFFKETRSY